MSVPSSWYKYKNPDPNKPSSANYSNKNTAKTLDFFDSILDGGSIFNLQLKFANGETTQHPIQDDRPGCSSVKSSAQLKYEKSAKKSSILRRFQNNSPANIDYFEPYDNCSLNDPCMFRDFFSDIDNTTLHEHTPELDTAGLGWLGNNLHFETRSGALAHVTSGDSVAYVITELSDLEISSTLNFGVGDSPQMGFSFRGSSDAQAYMQLRVVPDENVIVFGEVFAGGNTVHSWQNVTLNESSYDVSIRIVGDLFQFTVGDFYFEHTTPNLKDGLGAGIFSRSINMTSPSTFDKYIICPTEPEPVTLKML